MMIVVVVVLFLFLCENLCRIANFPYITASYLIKGLLISLRLLRINDNCIWGKETQRVTHGWGINKLNNEFLKIANAMGITRTYEPPREDKSKSIISDIDVFTSDI